MVKYIYDECGNPTTYKGKDLVWTRGRLLEQYPLSNGSFIQFSYNESGTRKRKFYFDGYGEFAGYVEYGVVNGKLMFERYSESIQLESFENIYYIYDQNEVIGLNIGGETYYYVKNMQGDVVQLRRAEDGELVASYEYDAWGNHKVYDEDDNENTDDSFVGNINPIRYRSYYWDRDLKMYYLQTRWYDPEIGRFINLDQIEYLDPEAVNGLNLYAYCNNNPVMNTDPDGAAWHIFWAAVIGALAGVAGQFISDVISGEWSSWQNYVGAAVGGAVTGVLIATGANAIGASVTGSLVADTVTLGLNLVTGQETRTAKEIWIDVTENAVLSGVFAFGGEIISSIFTRNIGPKLFAPLVKESVKYSVGSFGRELLIGIKDSIEEDIFDWFYYKIKGLFS